MFQCGNGGCLIELAQQLAVIMIGGGKLSITKILFTLAFHTYYLQTPITGKQIINNAQEIIIPKLKGWWQNFSVRLDGYF